MGFELFPGINALVNRLHVSYVLIYLLCDCELILYSNINKILGRKVEEIIGSIIFCSPVERTSSIGFFQEIRWQLQYYRRPKFYYPLFNSVIPNLVPNFGNIKEETFIKRKGNWQIEDKEDFPTLKTERLSSDFQC